MSEQLVAWRGKPIEQMTREELIEALNWCVKDRRALSAEYQRQAQVLREFRR